jgi:hypothetical protein
LGLQGHPEYNEVFQAGANFRIEKPQISEGYERYLEDYTSKNYDEQITQSFNLGICYSFLKC